MRECRPVSVAKNAFVFCRYSLAVLLWLGFILKLKELVLLSFVILLLSAIFKVRRAPLILLYTHTVERLFRGEDEVLDEGGMRFAHGFGAVVSLLCVIALYFGNERAGWILTLILCIVKTISAMGFCSALKLYGCMNSGTCCRVGRLVRGRDV